MTDDTGNGITLTLTSIQLLSIAQAIGFGANHGSGSNQIRITVSAEQLHDIGGQLRATIFSMADMGQTEMADAMGEVLAYVEQWPAASAQPGDDSQQSG